MTAGANSLDLIDTVVASRDENLAQYECDRLSNHIARDPLTKDYVHKSDYMKSVGRPLVISAVEDVLGERNVHAVAILQNLPQLVRDGLIAKGSSEFPYATTLHHAANMVKSIPYLWKSDIWNVAISTPLPKHVVGKCMPFPCMWMTFPFGIKGTGGVCLQSIMLVDMGNGIEVTITYDDGKGSWELDGFRIMYGDTYDPEYQSRGSDGCVLALLSFLASEYIAKNPSGLNRNQRRRMGREHHEFDEVRFVDLRQPKNNSHYETGEGSTVWNFRWIVRGHHRAQWYPSENCHKVKWIAPYVKGPGDCPIKQPAYAVVR